MYDKLIFFVAAFVSSIACAQTTPPPETESEKVDIWNMPELPVHPGAFEPDWQSLSRYQVPDWFREAKFGIWAHWDPQSVPEQGDWYSRNMYVPGHGQYKHCLKTYGHPSEFGYKDICGMWTCDKWNPDEFMKLAKAAGGKYFVALANHHDNYDCWDSRYQPWNSMNLGPKKDVVGIWAKTARKHDLPFGVTVHASPARTWGQFMPVRFRSDKSGKYKGVKYDAATVTKADGIGTPWEGLDPKDLYGMPHKEQEDANASPFANQFMWRVDDLLKYNPDLLYFDESVGTNQVDLGVKMGLGYLAPIIAANYYNRSMAANDGELRAVLNIKEVGGRRNSLPTIEDANLVSRCLVKDSEKKTENQIEAYPFQTDDSIGPWHMNVNRPYSHDATWVIRKLIDNVSKNGNLLLNIPQRAQGNVDPEAQQICRDIGQWLSVNGEAIYGSRPFEVYKSRAGKFHFTRNKRFIYVLCSELPDAKSIRIGELSTGSATIGSVSSIECLGSSASISFKQTDDDLRIDLPKAPNEIATVFKITHDKTWINDDDPGVRYRDWRHRVNRGQNEFNNDVHQSYVKGGRCWCEFDGAEISLVANVGPNAGKLLIMIDGQYDSTIDLASSPEVGVQKTVYRSAKLTAGPHRLDVVKLDNKLSSIDAFIVK